ncbi:MAG: hypothetical protein ACKE9I_02805 [Methylophagaceae bacterium]
MINQTIKRWLLLGCLLLLTLWLVWNTSEVDNSALIVKPMVRADANKSANTNHSVKYEDDLQLAQRLPFEGKAIDLFATSIKQQAARKPVKVKPIVRPLANRVTAPALPFKYIGKLSEGDVVKIFLLKGEALHIVSEGDTVDKHYQLKHVDEQQLSWLYLPLNITQKMSIGQTP